MSNIEIIGKENLEYQIEWEGDHFAANIHGLGGIKSEQHVFVYKEYVGNQNVLIIFPLANDRALFVECGLTAVRFDESGGIVAMFELLEAKFDTAEETRAFLEEITYPV